MKGKLFKEQYLFQFGKYNGTPVEEVYKKDPDYIKWVLKNLTGHKKELKLLSNIIDTIKEKKNFEKRVELDTIDIEH